MNTPDHNTIHRFRSDRLKEVLRQVFTQVVLLNYGNTHKILQQQNCPILILQAFDKIDADKVEKTIEQINEALKDKPVSKSVKQKLNYAKKNWSSNLKKYEQQEKILGERNSYSKTDHDASFMKMKEDHMKNGQLKPAYNFQISTNNQYIVTYSPHQATADTTTLQEHTEIYKQQYKQTPKAITADAGYGSEQNYQYLQDNQIENYVKYNYFDKDHRTKKNKKTFL